MGDYSVFLEILDKLQSTENDVRCQAESAYEAIPAVNRFTILLKVINDEAASMESLHLAAVLARRLILSDYRSTFEELSAEMQLAVKQQLLFSLKHGNDKVMKRKMADLTAELVRAQIEDDGTTRWPEFLSFILECSNSTDLALREIACHVFAAVPNVFGDQQNNNLIPIGQFLSQAISDPNSCDLRAVGMRALASFIVYNATSDAVLHALRDLVPIALQATLVGVQADPEDDTLLKALVEIADTAHKYLRPFLSSTLQLCYELLQMKQVGESVRHVALEVMVTLAENCPASVRKCSATIKSLVGTLLNLMTDVEEDETWDQADTTEDDDEDSTALTAELALDRLSCALVGQHVLSEIKQLVPEMLQNPDWKSRYAGLMAISACGEGSGKLMESMLVDVLNAVLGRLTDPHSRVRYAACNCIGQMASDFGPKLQKMHHSIVLPALVHVLDDPVPRVQANAGAALINFCEKVPQNILINYLDSLVLKIHEILMKLVDGDRKLVLMQIVTTLASVADAAEKKFTPYYDLFMPTLQLVMRKASMNKDLRLLRGKTIECISLIGLAVGKEKFLQDVQPVMELLLQAQMQNETETSIETDDPQVSYIISAWARMCKLLGRDFEPYLPKVMPQVLRSASIKPEICILDNNEAEDIGGDLEWQVVKLGEDQNYAIRTSGLEDKATACQMLVCYAREMRESFAPYAQQVMDIMIPLLDFYFNDEVRSAAAECLPYLLTSMKSNHLTGGSGLSAPWSVVHKGLLRAITNEPEREVVADHLLSLAGCIEAVGRADINGEQVNEIRVLLDHLFHEHFEKGNERLAKRLDEDYDDVEEERLMTEKDDDEYVMSKMCDVVHAIFVTFHGDAVPFFKQLMPLCVKLIEPDRPWSDLQWGICFWDDFIEFGGPHSWDCHQFFLPTFVKEIRHPRPEVRQTILYGIGVAAINGGPEYTGVLSEFVAPLIELIDASGSRSEENNLCTENAISAVTKMMKYRPDCIVPAFGSLDNLIARWLTWLPIWEDDAEVEHVYGCLCDLLEANHPALLGPDSANVPHIVRVIAEAMAKEGLVSDADLSDDRGPKPASGAASGDHDRVFGQSNGVAAGDKPSAYERCVHVLRYVQSNPSMAEACLNQLNEEQLKAINVALMGQ